VPRTSRSDLSYLSIAVLVPTPILILTPFLIMLLHYRVTRLVTIFLLL